MYMRTCMRVCVCVCVYGGKGEGKGMYPMKPC